MRRLTRLFPVLALGAVPVFAVLSQAPEPGAAPEREVSEVGESEARQDAAREGETQSESRESAASESEPRSESQPEGADQVAPEGEPQDEAIARAPQVEPGAEDVSDEDLETFADIYVDLEETLRSFETEIAQVETEQEAQDVQVRLQQESFDKIEERGWTPDKYNTVIQTVNADPALLQRALDLIEERS